MSRIVSDVWSQLSDSIACFFTADLMSYSEELLEDVGATASAEWEKYFHSGNPAVETTEGIIHLYKDK